MKALLLALAITLYVYPSRASDILCPNGDDTCVSKGDLEVFVSVLREKKCLQTTQPTFKLDPVTVITDVDGRVYYSGSDPHPYTIKMSWCGYDVTAIEKLNLVVAKKEPPIWGFRFRPKFAGSFLFVDSFNRSSAGEAVDVGVLFDFLYYKAFNLNVAAGFRSAGIGVGMDITRNFGGFIGAAYSWWTLKVNPQAGLYFSFW
jgi:hypothetical protein